MTNNKLREQAEKILRTEGYCYEHSDCGETMCLGTAANDEAIKQLFDLFRTTLQEIVGEDERMSETGSVAKPLARNALRAEQRANITNVLGEE